MDNNYIDICLFCVDSEYTLSKYSYTHDCLKMDQDLCFRIMRRQDVALPFIRTVSTHGQLL